MASASISSKFNIQTIPYQGSADSPKALVESLHTTGFAVITDHPITAERIKQFYASWGKFFASEKKHDWKFDPETQAGYFPFRSENAKGNALKDLKEFFHVYPNHKVPAELEEETRKMHDDLTTIGRTLLTWLQDNTPKEVLDKLSEPLPKMNEGSLLDLLRVLHYPALEGEVEPGAVRAAAHGDINLITVLLAGSSPGLQAKDTSGVWHDVPCDPGAIVINSGDMLELASGGYFPSTIHQVINFDGNKGERFSMPLFCHPRSEVVLDPKSGKTAGDYLKERLAELGLKK